MGKDKQNLNLKQALKDKAYAKKQAQKISKQMVKEMRPFMSKLKHVDLRKNLSPNVRGYLTKAWKEYTELTSKPFKIYRPKSKERLKKAQTIARHDKSKPQFDVAFIPSADPKAKIIFEKNKMKIKSTYVTEEFLFFDLKKLAIDPDKEIAKTLAKNPLAKQFVIMAGKYTYNGGLARSLVNFEVRKLMLAYNDPTNNNYFQNWLFGVISAEYERQSDANEYRRAFQKAKNIAKTERRAKRRNRKKYFGKKF